jgi:hypothetical protein
MTNSNIPSLSSEPIIGRFVIKSFSFPLAFRRGRRRGLFLRRAGCGQS